MRRQQRGSAALLLTLGLFVACTGDTRPPRAAGSSTVGSSSEGPTTATRPTTTDTTTPPLYAELSADVDGDRPADHLQIIVEDGAPVLVADMSGLGHQSLPVPIDQEILDQQRSGRPFTFAAIDIASTVRAEIFVEVSHGASTGFLTMFRLVAGHLTQMTLDGQPVNLGLNGSVGHQSVIGCGTGTLISAGWGTNDQFKTFDGQRDEYSLVNARLVLLRSTTHTFQADDMGAPVGLAAAGYDLHCPPLD
jgi:hypothetical protein